MNTSNKYECSKPFHSFEKTKGSVGKKSLKKIIAYNGRVLPKWGFIAQKPIKSTTAEHSTNVH